MLCRAPSKQARQGEVAGPIVRGGGGLLDLSRMKAGEIDDAGEQASHGAVPDDESLPAGDYWPDFRYRDPCVLPWGWYFAVGLA